MKIWISDIQSPNNCIIKLNCEDHSGFKYLGDLDDKKLRDFLLGLQENINVDKNIKLLKYYGYLHLFIISKK